MTLPRIWKSVRWRLGRTGVLVRHAGRRVECPCCERRFRGFIAHPWGADGICPGCGSYERHRALWLLLRGSDLLVAGGRVLHCAPEAALQRRLIQTGGVEYVGVDLDAPLASIHADLTALPFPADRFDVVIASHVLEHVADDRAALVEIHRVLRPGGVALLMLPVHGGLAETLEDPNVQTPEQRLAIYGQADHVRLYGRDVTDRIADAGFAVEQVDARADLTSREVARFGLGPDDPIYVCRPSP